MRKGELEIRLVKHVLTIKIVWVHTAAASTHGLDSDSRIANQVALEPRDQFEESFSPSRPGRGLQLAHELTTSLLRGW